MNEVVDFRGRTFLERVSLAAREPVYSAAFAWVLGEHSPLPLKNRLSIIRNTFGVDAPSGEWIETITEWNDVDLLLTVKRKAGDVHIAIENKIKATEGVQQLAIYDQELMKLSGPVQKVFLTLTGEAPRSGSGWNPVSYSSLSSALSAQGLQTDPYYTDLCRALSRLVAVARDVRDNQELVGFAFDDESVLTGNDLTTYVAEMRLKKVAQRIWMGELAGKLGVAPPWQISINESHGQALINVEASLAEIPGYLIGLQLQWRTLKAFCSPHPYPKVATEVQHRDIEDILDKIRSNLSLAAGARASRAQGRGFRSFSVATLPAGRNLNDWVGVVGPHLFNLNAAFPTVRTPAT